MWRLNDKKNSSSANEPSRSGYRCYYPQPIIRRLLSVGASSDSKINSRTRPTLRWERDRASSTIGRKARLWFSRWQKCDGESRLDVAVLRGMGGCRENDDSPQRARSKGDQAPKEKAVHEGATILNNGGTALVSIKRRPATLHGNRSVRRHEGRCTSSRV